MMRTLILGLATLIALAPLAPAEGEDASGGQPADEGQPAWVENCPPDRMCAMQETREEPVSDGPAHEDDCGDEGCASDAPDRPVSSDEGATCMDGRQEGETCRDDVQYLTPGRGPEDCELCRGGEDDGAEAGPASEPAPEREDDAGVASIADVQAGVKGVPGAQAAAIFGAAIVAVFLVARARR